MNFLDACSDHRRIETADGAPTTVYSYKPAGDGEPLFSGIGPATVGLFGYEVNRYGHAVLTDPGSRSWNHRVAGVGLGHDDAKFAECGSSMAAYYENGDAWGGPWWEQPGGGVKHFGL